MIQTIREQFYNQWSRLWHGKDPDLFLFTAGMVTAVVMAFPIFYVVFRSFAAGAHRWSRLLDGLPTFLVERQYDSIFATIHAVNGVIAKPGITPDR